MKLGREEGDCWLLQELADNNNCRRENEKSPAMPQTIRTDEQPFYSAHSGKITNRSIRAHISPADYRMRSPCRCIFSDRTMPLLLLGREDRDAQLRPRNK